ncbi:nucleotide-diphospho-sugar transferase [Gongronella butleri]|nr:nucleotide-diphospho-sugar transferase [Gongronella butleri]
MFPPRNGVNNGGVIDGIHQFGIIDDGRHDNKEDSVAGIVQIEQSKYGKALKPPGHKDRVKACFVILARNQDAIKMKLAVRSLEDRFNHKFHYPYVFLNDEPFSEEFIKMAKDVISSKAEFGLIPLEGTPEAQNMTWWGYPPHIDLDKAREGREFMMKLPQPPAYAINEVYRHMCRFQSGFFFRHELLKKYDYYWRVEPHVEFTCDIDYDLFQFMSDNKIKYGFNIGLYENLYSVPSLWKETKKFLEKHPEMAKWDNDSMTKLVTNEDMESYSGCHFWSNFEIAALDVFRNDRYIEYFNHLDASGGFHYERWGDAPVHSIYTALTLKKHEIHFFADVGYVHRPIQHCPMMPWYDPKCICDPDKSIDWSGGSCLLRYKDIKEDFMPFTEEAYLEQTNPYRIKKTIVEY